MGSESGAELAGGVGNAIERQGAAVTVVEGGISRRNTVTVRTADASNLDPVAGGRVERDGQRLIARRSVDAQV